MFIYSEIRLYKRLNTQEGNWSSSYTQIIDAFSKNIHIGLGTKKDSFKFNILNSYNKFYLNDNVFEKGDKIEVYQVVNSKVVTSNNLLIDGVITSITNSSDTSKYLTIEGKSRTEMFLEGLTVVTMSSPLTVPEILEEALNFHNRNNKNFQITWHPDNPSLKSDGVTSFPSYQIETFFKSMNITFETYSSNEYTQDGNYYYYLDKNNYLVWDKKNSISEGIIYETDCKSVKIEDDNTDVVNSVIFNAGNLPNGNIVRSYYYDYDSRNEHGAKWKYLTSTANTISNLIKTEQDNNSVYFTDTSGNYPSSYPYTTYTDSTSIANAGEWNAWLKQIGLDRAKAVAKSYCQGVNESLIRVNATLPFTTNYVIGGVYTCYFPSGNINGIILRVNEIIYDDYNTTLYLRQDTSI